MKEVGRENRMLPIIVAFLMFLSVAKDYFIIYLVCHTCKYIHMCFLFYNGDILHSDILHLCMCHPYSFTIHHTRKSGLGTGVQFSFITNSHVLNADSTKGEETGASYRS